jgi:hypothetical protein
VSRVYAIVEGTTEESFVSGPLAEALRQRGVYITPIILGVPGHQGGRTNYARVKKDILLRLKQDQRSYCTTMIDFYGLGQGFPGTPLPTHLSARRKVEQLERAVKDDVCREIPQFRPDLRLIPYLALHEYEALLFSDPAAFAHSLGQLTLAEHFQGIRDEFPTPEEIDNDPETAPSKRIIALHSSYKKVIEGTIAAKAVGIQRMRQECPHFNAWLDKIEALPEL